MDDLEAILERIRERVTPEEAERTRLAAAVERLTGRLEAAVADLPVDAEVRHVGSTARGTWLPGDRDIDLFVCFPPALEEERLETYGLQVGREVLPDGREEFADHPYVTGQVNGFDVDVVPCYAVDAATDIRSAVDRTPFHNDYLCEHLPESLQVEVRICKRFLTATGVYGSDLRTRGFSGFLTELLVLEYGGFRAFMQAVADWTPPVRFDPEAHGEVDFDAPLIVVDPTDPRRNVAAVCSGEMVARLQHYARDLLAEPRVDCFDRQEPTPLSADAVTAHVERRGTTPVVVVFDAPEVVEDQLYPQLRRSLAGVVGELDRRGFSPLRSATFADDRGVLLVELAVATLPAVERHEGPPLGVRDHARGFYGTYADDPSAYGPFLDDDRYVVERPRQFTDAVALLESDALFDVALGADVRDRLQEGYQVRSGTAVASLADEFGRELARYFEPSP